MIVKILAVQIPFFWEAIKFCATSADEVKKEELPEYLNQMLQALLSDKSQCFVRLNDKRILMGVMITKVEINKRTKKSNLDIQCLYSYQQVSNDGWKTDYAFIKKFAEKVECASITFTTRNSRVAELGSFIGFKEKNRFYELCLGGN